MKKLILLFGIVGLLFVVLPLTANADIVANGTCGDNLTWTLDDEGFLTISGSGAMMNFGDEDPNWYLYINRIKSVFLDDRIALHLVTVDLIV